MPRHYSMDDPERGDAAPLLGSPSWDHVVFADTEKPQHSRLPRFNCFPHINFIPKKFHVDWAHTRLFGGGAIRNTAILYNERFPHQEAGYDMRRQRQKTIDALERLAFCTETETCTKAEETIIVCAHWHFPNALNGGTSGEDIWAKSTHNRAKSTLNSLRALNHTVLVGFDHMAALMLYQTFPDQVPVVIIEGSSINKCVERTARQGKDENGTLTSEGPWQLYKNKGCVQSPTYPEGIPLWKMFAFHFWRGAQSPLGIAWTLAPEEYGEGAITLGYSIEERCSRLPLVEKRNHSGFIFAKHVNYFSEKANVYYHKMEAAMKTVPAEIDPVDGHEVPFGLTATAGRETYNLTRPADVIDEPGVTNFGRLPQAEWGLHLASSKVMIGVGAPVLSPSPYEALCHGVPFVNPIIDWDRKDPNNRAKWRLQQPGLMHVDEPYVYHVYKDDGEGLAAALRKAVANPIGRYIPPAMRKDATIERHRQLIETDWLARCREHVKAKYPEGSKQRTEWCMGPETEEEESEESGDVN